MTKLRQRMMEGLELRNSSEETIRSYISGVKLFARHYGKSPELMNAEDVRQYLLHLRNERKLSWPTIQGSRAALRFLYTRGRDCDLAEIQSVLVRNSNLTKHLLICAGQTLGDRSCVTLGLYLE